ncbi:MAG: TIM44-like domain-containing protein [Bacilli bacterium]|nr:TIM44-like domain-containing protein [Bacilli bacterium]
MNRGNNEEDKKIKRKKFNYYLILILSLIFSPVFYLSILCFFMGIITFDLWKIFMSILIFVGIYSTLESLLLGSMNILIYGKDIVNYSEATVKKEKPIVSITEKKEYNSRVEGIIGERERDIIDTDDDGHILVQEFYPLTESDVLFKIMKKDNNFSKKDFYDYVKKLFLVMQEAWSNNDYFRLRSFEADRLFYRHKRELERLISLEENDIRDNVGIKGVLLKDFRIENNKQILVVALTANMRRKYNKKTTTEDYPYILVFSRNVGVKTKKEVKLSVTNCCNCGAKVNVSEEGICKYCDTSLVSGEHEWVLVDMKLINIDIA